MFDEAPLIAAMAEQCRDMIVTWDKPGLDQPMPLQPKHLKWMCDRIAKHANDWPATKVHRWIGFVQGAMIANRIISLDEAKTMFDKAKNAYGDTSEDLVDHLNPDGFSGLDIGGQG